VILAGFSLAFLAFRSLGTNYSGTVVIKDSHTLVTSGPYRWIRHPIYTSYFALTLSLFLLTANWFIGLALLALSILLASRVEGEEALLLERFGDAYRAYMYRTGRFLPRLLRRQ
ncbi:MAG: isoprenylcysteine carboxylmethyltransferase family protein, partial [Thermoplasmata archaeon]